MTNLKAKKSLGQNFLKDPYYITKIIESFDLKNDDIVVEVGPGKGILTKQLINKAGKVYAVEIDHRMYDHLTATIKSDKLNLILDDFLKFDFENIIKEKKVKVVGNVPYQVTSGIIFKVMDLVYSFHQKQKEIESLTIMIQKEVAERIVANPNTKAYGIISVLTSFFSAKRELLFDVPPEAFTPKPKVTSSIIKFTFNKENPYFDQMKDYKFFKRVVKTVFQNRRKMLRNTLKHFNIALEKIQTVEITKRPENLTLDDFITLSNEIMKLQEEKKLSSPVEEQ